MRKHFPRLLLLLVIGLFTFSGCLPEFNFNTDELDDTWQPGYAIPILNTTLSLDNALDNFETGGFVSTAADGMITIVYRGETFTGLGGQMFDLPDMPIPILTNPQTAVIPLPTWFELDNITLKNGDLVYGGSSLNLQPVNVALTLQDLTNNGTPLLVQFTIPASNGVSLASFQDTISIDETNLSLSNNEFTTQYTATFPNGMPAVLVAAGVQLNNLEYSYMDGYFGVRTLNTNAQTSVIDLFTNWTQGNIEFVDPKVRLTFTNSYGIPMTFGIDSLSAVTHFNGVQQLQSTALNNVALNYPSLSQIGTSVQTELLLETSNSNIENLMSGVPYKFHYDFVANANPNNNTSLDNFITDSSQLTVDVDVELPMYGNIGLFSLRDTFNFDFSAYEELDRMKLKLTTDNGFPFEVNTQVYFLDEMNNLIDSLFTSSSLLLGAASVDVDGNVIANNVNVQERDFEMDAFARLKGGAKKVAIYGSIETVNGGTTPVKILSSYKVTFQLGAIIGF